MMIPMRTIPLLLALLGACSLDYDLPSPDALGIPRVASDVRVVVSCGADPSWLELDLPDACVADQAAWSRDAVEAWVAWANASCPGGGVHVDHHYVATAVPCDPATFAPDALPACADLGCSGELLCRSRDVCTCDGSDCRP